MKLCFVLLFSSVFIPPHHAASTYHTIRVAYETLMDEDACSSSNVHQDFLDALTSVGLVSITGIPSSRFRKQDILSWGFHECAMRTGAAQVYTFPDGTDLR